MTADRHALLAALDYSTKQGQEINLLQEQIGHVQHENRQLRRRLHECRASLDGGDNRGPENLCNPAPPQGHFKTATQQGRMVEETPY